TRFSRDWSSDVCSSDLLNGTNWVVFEPNDMDLWGRIRRTISAFLYRVWLDGALFGATPEQAFYVKCDDETNPSEVIEAGQVVCRSEERRVGKDCRYETA